MPFTHQCLVQSMHEWGSVGLQGMFSMLSIILDISCYLSSEKGRGPVLNKLHPIPLRMLYGWIGLVFQFGFWRIFFFILSFWILLLYILEKWHNLSFQQLCIPFNQKCFVFSWNWSHGLGEGNIACKILNARNFLTTCPCNTRSPSYGQIWVPLKNAFFSKFLWYWPCAFGEDNF